MCGIAGLATNSAFEKHVVTRRIERMIDSLRHRGPDDSGMLVSSQVALGHTRLSIIDLSSCGQQPMSNEDGTVHLVFNGEIYNFQSLRDELVKFGHRFASKTDSEVLIHGYEQWGFSGLLQRIEGMFAFAIWDQSQQILRLARDHFGIKPLYFAIREGELVFGSEPKAIFSADGRQPKMNPEALLSSLHHMGVPAPATMYQDYAELEPGCCLSFELQSGRVTKQQYWSWKIDPEIDDPHQAAELLWQTIRKSVEKQLLADVDVGLFLSGGLDSSLIAAACAELGHKPTCLTIALKDARVDESPFAAALCKHYGLTHWIESMNVETAQHYDERIADIFDEPFAASSALSTAYVAETASSRFKVMLSGEGGDELFGGYRWYRDWIDRYQYEGRSYKSLGNTLRRWFGRKSFPADPTSGYAHLIGAFSAKQIVGLFARDFLSRCPAAA